jgi:hypothetical protein
MSHSWRKVWGPSEQQQQLLRIILEGSQSEAIKWSTTSEMFKRDDRCAITPPHLEGNKKEQENGEDYE